MELIERYIYAVTRRLPIDQREDVADELRGTIQDQLDETDSHSVSDIKKILVSLGDPELLAQRYSDKKQYLIGPTVYPIFIKTLKLTFAIGLPIAFVVQFISQLNASPFSLIELLLGSMGAAIAIGIQMIFWVGLVFFVLERSNIQAKDLRKYQGEWSPSMLPKLSKHRQIPISDAVTDIVSYGVLLILPFIVQFIGIHTDAGIIPFFNPEIGNVVTPIIIVMGVIGIIKGILKLQQRNWSRWLAVVNLAFAIVASAALILAFTTITIINPEFIVTISQNVTTSSLAQINDWAVWTLGITIAICVLIYLFDGIKYIPLAFRSRKEI